MIGPPVSSMLLYCTWTFIQYIKSTIVLLKWGLERCKVTTCTSGIGAAPQKTNQRNAKNVQTRSLCYSIANYLLTKFC